MLKSAMIMAAGVGSRLDPLTKTTPKPLIPLGNIPVTDILLKHLSKYGIEKIVANTYCLAEQIEERYKNYEEIKCSFVREETLSGTAGGVKKCEWFFEDAEDLIVLSSDGLTDVNLKEFYDNHKKSDALVSIALKEIDWSEVSHFGVIVRDENGLVKEFQEKPALEDAKSNLVSTGIYLFKKEIFDYIPADTFYDFAKNVFPAIMNDGKKINTYLINGYWNDIGTINQYKLSTIDLMESKINVNCKLNVVEYKNSKLIKGKNVTIEEGAVLEGYNVFGDNCTIKAGACIKNSILWNNVIVNNGVSIDSSIIGNNNTIENSQSETVIGSK